MIDIKVKSAMKNLINIFFLIMFSFFCIGQEKELDFVIEYVSTRDGLSHNYVSKVVSDSLNIKWIATENGITKYDGENYSVVSPGEKYPELKSENIETLFVDSKNNLWIGTKTSGLCKLEIETNKLLSYNHILSKKKINSFRIIVIEEDYAGNIWVGSENNGVFVINDQKKSLVNKYNFPLVKDIIKDSNGIVWIANKNKLRKYNPWSDKMQTFKFEYYITKVVEDTSRKCFWVSTYNETKNSNVVLKHFDPKNNIITPIKTNIPLNFASTLFLDKENKLWVGTWGGGLYYSNNDITKFYNQNLDAHSDKQTNINYNIILDIHSDKNNILWISSNFAGIVKLTKGKGFKNLNQVLGDSELKQELHFHSIYKDNDDLLLGTIRNGLYYGSGFTSLKQSKVANLGKIHSIFKSKSYYAIGTDQTLFLDKNKKLLSMLDIPKATTFLQKNENVIWMGTQQDGLFLVDVSNIKSPKIIEKFTVTKSKNKIESNRITSIVRDGFSNLWLGTYFGLHLFNSESGTFVHHRKLLVDYIPNIINTIYTDSEFIWLGTPKGLYKLLYTNNKLKLVNIYSTKDGLINDFICGITSDERNNLWLTTTTSLVRFDQYEETFNNYGKNDGVGTSVFNLRSLFKTKNNSMILAGGIDNLTYFNPEKLNYKKTSDQLIFTYLKIDNKIVHANDSINKRLFIKKEFSYVDSIEISHKEKSFTVGFNSNGFSDKIATNYRYRLIGYQDEWIPLKQKNEINFTGLPSGEYELHISCSKDSKNWVPSKKLTIKVLPAPLSSPFAFFIYFLIFLAISISFLVFYLKQNNLRHKLKLAKLEKEKENELNESKLTFFTNISHEFRTPLTLIMGPVKEVLGTKNLKTNITEKLVIVEKNAERLLNLTNQLLDFRKADHGLLKLNIQNDNIVYFAYEVFMYFKELAESKNIEFNFKSEEDVIKLPFDKSKMEIAISNLISNSLKYTKIGGSISMNIKTLEDKCIISIIDTGIGIEKVHQKKIFDRFYQIKNTNTAQIIGSGIGLSFTKKLIELHDGTIEVNSTLNEGTTFVVELPFSGAGILTETNNMQLEVTDDISNYKELTSEGVSLNLNIESHENTILIIDDNEDIRNYLDSLLNNDYDIVMAVDGEEGVEMASKMIPDLIICDMMMPKKDGLAVCKELKAQVITSHIPIIMLTARSSNLFEIEGLKTGADDFVSKPFDPQVIKARISSALQNRLKIREHYLNKVRFEPSKKEVDVNDAEATFVNKAINLVEENLLEDSFGIETMMSELHMSQSTLYRKIKSLTGLSLTGFIRSVRLKKAAELILTENNKLSYVAMSVGFNDNKHFRESFKKQFGCLPSEYKNKTIEKLK